MEGIRLAGMFYDQRGPLVFSASVHLVILVVAAILALISPEKDPEEFTFELVPPPAPSSASEPVADQPLEPVRYQRDETELPTLDEIEIPERPPVVVEVDMPQPEVQEPVREEPVVEVEPPQAKPMTWQEYAAQNPDATRIKNVDTTPRRAQTPQVDLNRIRQNLSEFTISNLPSTEIETYSAADQQALSNYLSTFKAALRQAVRSHPIRGNALSATVRCDISAGGFVSNARIVRSSGDSVFDKKILDGYAALRSFRPPPKGTPLIGLQIEFVQSN